MTPASTPRYVANAHGCCRRCYENPLPPVGGYRHTLVPISSVRIAPGEYFEVVVEEEVHSCFGYVIVLKTHALGT
jgi:hypothetical protein